MGRRIGGAGGGSDPGSGKSGKALVAAAAAIAVAAGGGGVIGGGTAGTAAESALARNLGAKKADAKNSARRGDTNGAWQRMGLRALKQRAERYTECVAHSVGQVQEFLARTPCRRLDRMLSSSPTAVGTWP